jgi:hemerythrin-like domain-containing protein
MTPTETLKHEHEVVLLVLTGAERENVAIRESGRANIANVEKMVDFFRMFVDRCHHTKEERYLFPALCRRGLVITKAPISVLLTEHEAGRQCVKGLTGALSGMKEARPQSAAALADGLLAYVTLLREHIAKEDNCLFPMAEQMLTAEDQGELSKAFDNVESTEMGEGVHEKYHTLAHELANG